MSSSHAPGVAGMTGNWHIVTNADLPERWRLHQELDQLGSHWYEGHSRRRRQRIWQRLCHQQPVLVDVDPHNLRLNQNSQSDIAAIVAVIAAAASEPEAAIALVVATSNYWAKCSRRRTTVDAGALFSAIRSVPADTPSLLTIPLTVILRQAVREGDDVAFRPLVRTRPLPRRMGRAGCVRPGQHLSWLGLGFTEPEGVEDHVISGLAGAEMLASAGHLLNAKKSASLAILVGQEVPTTSKTPASDETTRRHRVQETERIARKHGLLRSA